MPPCRALALIIAISLLVVIEPAVASIELPAGSGSIDTTPRWPGTAPQAAARPSRAQPTARVWPRLSSRFGYRRHPISHAVALHSGIDIPAPLGTPVQASASGRVRFAGRAGGYGNMVEIDHGAGLATRYAHLSSVLVRPGQPVFQGETIALMGSTGRSTGSHLHFEVRTHGRATDPLAYLVPVAGMVAAPPAFDYRPIPSEPSAPHVSKFARSRDAIAALFGDGSRATIRSLP